MSIVDDWGMDNYEGLQVNPKYAPEEIPLPKFLTDLRDGLAPPPPDAGLARSKQLDKMAKDVHDIQEFVKNLDIYAKHAKLAPLTDAQVGPYMEKYIRELRAELVDKGTNLYKELEYKRSHT